MTFAEDFTEACHACIDVKSWFRENKPKMAASAFIVASLIYKDPVIEDPVANKVSSSGVVCPPDAKELGRSTWTFLHTTTAYLPENLSDEKRVEVSKLLTAVSNLYPCKSCAQHMRNYMEVFPPDYQSRTSISEWLCAFHNEVNDSLGKEKFDCTKLNERWKSGPPDSSCSN